ncbi:MAG: DUF1294 domain-containing protein [Lachnospirales bacterium]
MLKYIILYYVIVNIITFFLMYSDKKRAVKGMWRISEHTFMVLSLLGGFVGMFVAMGKFHHKTKKYYFYIWAILGLAIHLGLAIYLFM